MEPTHLLLVLGLFGLCALYRGAHRLRPLQLGSDSWQYINVAEVIRQNRGRYPREIPRFLLSGPFDYPPLLHYLLAVFPRRTRERAEGWVGPLTDGAHMLLLWWFVQTATGNAAAATIAALLFIVSPVLSRGTERALTLTPKPLGDLLVSLAMVALYFYLPARDPLWFGVLAVWTAVLLMAHKFSTQALLFLVLVFAAAYRDGLPLAALGLGMLLAILASRGHYLTILRGHVEHLQYWRAHLVGRVVGISEDHFWADFGRILRAIAREPRKALALVYRNPVLNFLAYNPWLLLVPAPLLLSGPNPAPELLPFLHLWFWTTAALVVVVSLKWLKFIGSPQYYGEYGVFPMAAILGLWLNGGAPAWAWAAVVGLAAYSLWANAINLRAVLRSDQNFSTPEVREMVAFLCRQNPSRVMPIPMNWGHALVYLTPHEVFCWNTTFRHLERRYGVNELFSVLPYPNPEVLPETLKRFGIRWIVNWKRGAEAGDFIGSVLSHESYASTYDFTPYRKVFENVKFVVYEVVPA